MAMNDIFNLNRFGLLFKKTLSERPAQLAGLMAVILLVTFGLFAFSVHYNRWNAAHSQAFIWGYIGGGILMAAIVFNYFNTNASGAGYLTLPASAFEKWLCGALIAGVLFTAVFLGFFRLIDTIFVNAYKNDPVPDVFFGKPEIYAFNGRLPRQAYAIFANFAGAIMLGTLYFNKASFVKSALAVAVIVLAVFMLNYVVAAIVFDKVSSVSGAVPFNEVSLAVSNPAVHSFQIRSFGLPTATAGFFAAIWKYVLPAILWITAFIRLQEKEI